MKQAHPAKDNLIPEFPWNPPHEPNWGFKGAVVLWMFRTCLKIHLPFTPTRAPSGGRGSLFAPSRGKGNYKTVGTGGCARQVQTAAWEMRSVVAERRWINVRRKTLRNRTWQFNDTWEITVELILRRDVSPSALMLAVRLVLVR